jgi:hypothetical protein
LREPGYGPAVIRIEDSKGGSEGYTFDIFWAGGGGYGGGGYKGAGYGQGGWNNGWGNGTGWINNGSFNFEGGRRGAGSYVDRNGQQRRLDGARVQIGQSGNMAVAFQSDSGTIAFRGNVERRDGRRLYSRVNGSGMFGLMEIEMSSQNTVRRIIMNDVGLSWFN